MKQKFINSISLLAVCAVLSGCGDANKQKSMLELITEVGQDSQKLRALALGALNQAKLKGVPLSSEVERMFEEDTQEGLNPPLSTAKDVLSELAETVADLGVLESQDLNLQSLFKIRQAKKAKIKVLRELMVAKARAVAAAKAAGEAVDPDDDLSLTVPNNSFADAGALTGPSAISTVAAASVQDLFLQPGNTPVRRTDLTVPGQPALGEARLTIPGPSGLPDDSSVLRFAVDPAAFAQGVGNIVEQWLHPAAQADDRSGAVVVSGTPRTPRIPTNEAVRQTMELGLSVSRFTGALLGSNADPELVASLTNIGALDTVQRSAAFRALTAPQQQLALQAALAIAHATPAGDSLRLEDRVNAVILAIAALPSSGTNESRIVAVQAALRIQGVTNSLLLTDTIRALTVITQTSGMTSQEQSRILGTVLMLANNAVGVISDADFTALVAAVRANPQLLLGNSPTAPMPARFTLDPSVLALLRSRILAIDALPWSAVSTSAAFIQAVGQQMQQKIAAGAPVDSTSGALVTGLAAARHAKNALVPGGNGSVGAFGDSSVSALSLAQTINLLPTTTALDILVKAQELAVQTASAARAEVVPLLALTDGSSAANIPIDPAVEMANFMEKYNSLIGSTRQTILLSQLKSNIEAIRRGGNFQKFAGVPEPRGAKGLDSFCSLPIEYAKLLYSANDRDEIVIPRLVGFIINNKKLASKLEYYTNGTPGSRRLFDSIKGQPLYDTVLVDLGTQIDKYLSDMRSSVFDLMYPSDSRVEELSATTSRDLSSNVSLRQARTAVTGLVDGRAFNMNGVAGQSVELGLPLFVQLKGEVSSAKATEAATGSVAYRLGNTVIGAIQGYANSGAGFGLDSRQLETSVVASHSFGSFFVEGQIGSVSATEVHNSNWSGLRSQVTLGLDTEFVSPFVQLTHRQLDRSGLDLSETTAYVGLDAEVAKLAADTYSVDTRLLAKAGYGSKNWSATSKDLGSKSGFSGSVEWSASLNLNSGVSFGTNLALDTQTGSSAALNVSLDR